MALDPGATMALILDLDRLAGAGGDYDFADDTEKRPDTTLH